MPGYLSCRKILIDNGVREIMLKTVPAVFAVGSCYQIMVEVCREALVSVRVGDKTYYDASNGIINSRSPIHRVSVPMKQLDRERGYTLCVRPIICRKPYFTETEESLEYSYSFNPVPEQNIRVYHISDAHNQIEAPVAAARTFGKVDLLILNGDVIDHSGDPEKFANIYEICARITGGEVPVVFSRGNHDMRGNYAERFADYTPNCYGNTYYTFRLGGLWGMVLDCGEDKEDTHPEYGFTVACHAFRERQTEFIEEVIRDSQREYAAPGVETRLVIAHNPFPRRLEEPFDIEEGIYRRWCELLREHIKPHLMICGHTHECAINPPGCGEDAYGQPCTVVIASEPQKDRFIGGGFILDADAIEVMFTDSLGNRTPVERIQK